MVGGIFVQSLRPSTPDHPPKTTASTSITSNKPANKNLYNISFRTYASEEKG